VFPFNVVHRIIVKLLDTAVSFLDTTATAIHRYTVDVKIFPIFGAVFGNAEL
jgi:hypothetical protein